MANPKKKQNLQYIFDSIQQNNGNFTLLQFEKTSHQKLEELRAKLRQADSKMRVIKNSLFTKAVNKLIEQDREYQDLKQAAKNIKDQSILLTLGQDWATGIKAFHEFAKNEDTLSFKVGYIDKKIYEQKGLEALAKLPGKEQLMAKLLGTMKNPIAKTTHALTYNLQKLAYILHERGKQTE